MPENNLSMLYIHKKWKLTVLVASILLTLFPLIGYGQICDGNLGENIFESGDFGSGNANVVLQDPQIAPGFQYLINPPPSDGFYTITNHTGQWPNIFDGWLMIGDNSSDPNGYMMVVNASYDPGLFYEQEITGLCDNTLYEFSADVINLIAPNRNFIFPNISFLIDGASVFTTGDVPENAQWNTYGFTFITEPGQNTVTLSLRNNAPGGIGNDLAIDNITFRPCGPQAQILPTEIANICEDGDPISLEATVIGDQYDTPAFQWQQSFDEGVTWQNIAGANDMNYNHTQLASGVYYYRYLLANGMSNLLNSKCRVVSNTKIVNVVPKFYDIIETICEGLEYNIGDNSYTMSGMYVDSLVSTLGCDSIVRLDLTILADPNIDVDLNLNSPSCSDSEDGSIVINEIINGSVPYSIWFDGINSLGLQTFPNLAEGQYALVIEDQFGCSFEDSIMLAGPPSVDIDLGEDLVVDLGDEVDILAQISEALPILNWLPDELNDCEPNCLAVQWLPLQSTMVYLTGSSINGCPAIDSVFVSVNAERKVYIPNVFSPNDDGVNDKFTIFGSVPNIQEIEKLSVFNRWGDVVFEQNNFQPNDQTNGWKGTFNGEIVDQGVYIYVAQIRFLDGQIIEFSGDIGLLR